MATYYREYPYMPFRRKKQKYSLITRVIDFTNNLPVTSGDLNQPEGGGSATTAWAANDTLKVMPIRAKQTVMNVQVEVLTPSSDSGDWISVGFGTDFAYWGRYLLSGAAEVKNPDEFHQAQAFRYFASADTIDIRIHKAALQGKIRLIVHLLEDDR